MNNLKLNKTEDKICFFLGAGASIFPPSCLPLANKLKEDIFTELFSIFNIKALCSDINSLNKFPLEFILQVINDIWGAKYVMEALAPLNSGMPGPIHLTLARICQMGLCNVICTVNFDNLIEIALDNYLVKYKVITEDNVPLPPNPMDKDIIYVYKLHGSLSVSHTLIATLTRLGKPLSVSKLRLLQQLFDSRKVIFIGYRGADWDLKAQLNIEIKKNPYNVYWNSLRKADIDPIILDVLPKSQIFAISAIDFIREVLYNIKDQSKINFPDRPNDASTIVIRILRHTGQFKGVLRVLNSIYPKDSILEPYDKLNYFRMRYYIGIGLGKWNEAKIWLEKAFKMLNMISPDTLNFEKFRLNYEKGKFLISIGESSGIFILKDLLCEVKQLKKSKSAKWYQMVLIGLLLENFPNEVINESNCNEYLDLSYKLVGSHIQERAVVDRTKAIVMSRQKKYRQAIDLFEQISPLLETTGDLNGLLILYRELGRAYGEIENYKRAKEIITFGIALAQNKISPNIIREFELKEELAIVYFRSNQRKKFEKLSFEIINHYNNLGAPLRIEKFNERLN